MVEISSHSVLYHDGHDDDNDEEKVLSETEIVTNDDDQICDGSNWKDRHDKVILCRRAPTKSIDNE